MTRREHLPIVGWREWVALPDLGVVAVKAKIDTGARSSSLHAYDVETFRKDGIEFARFGVCPIQRTREGAVTAVSPVLEHRRVKSSSGHVQLRPVILTNLELLGRRWEIEVTLASRDRMGFRLLLGREAIRNRLVVDAGRSYYGKRPPRLVRRPHTKGRTSRTRRKDRS
jgi:hypothetical protein